MDISKSVSASVAPPQDGDVYEMREAELNFDADGDPLEVLVYLNDDDLEKAGVNTSQCEQAAYCVSDGSIELFFPDREVKRRMSKQAIVYPPEEMVQE